MGKTVRKTKRRNKVSELKQLARIENGPVPGTKVFKSKKHYDRKKEKSINLDY